MSPIKLWLVSSQNNMLKRIICTLLYQYIVHRLSKKIQQIFIVLVSRQCLFLQTFVVFIQHRVDCM